MHLYSHRLAQPYLPPSPFSLREGRSMRREGVIREGFTPAAKSIPLS